MGNSFFELRLDDLCEDIKNVYGNYINSSIIRKILTFVLFVICNVLFLMDAFFLYYI